LYCGKEIGAFRLLKDREFCRPDHRRKYGNRLGKAIHQLAEPEPAPAGVANFVLTMPVQAGSLNRSLAPTMRPSRVSHVQSLNGNGDPADAFRTPPFTLRIVSPSEEPPTEQAPPVLHNAVQAPKAEPVFSFVQAVAATEAAPCAIPVQFVSALRPLNPIAAAHAPALQRICLPVPAPEAVFTRLEPSCALDVTVGHHTPILPAAPSVEKQLPMQESESEVPAARQRPMRGPQPEPVAAFVVAAAVLQPVAGAASVALPVFDAQLKPLPMPDAPAEPAVQPEPVSSFVQPATTLEIAVVPAAIQLPQLTAQAEPMLTDELVEPPPPSQTWMPSPPAEPVFAFVRAAAADRSRSVIAMRDLGMGGMAVTEPHIPSILSFRAVPRPEPVMAGVWPHVADIPFEPILSDGQIQLPQISALNVPAAQPSASPAVPGAAAEPVETRIAASEATATIAAESANCVLPAGRIAPAALLGGPQLAAHAGGPAPEALESKLTASTAGQIKSAPVVRLQPFAVAASEGRALTGFDAPRLAPPATKAPAAPRKLVVMPLTTIRVAIPKAEPPAFLPGVPKPGPVPLEFHAQQVRGRSNCKLEWRTPRFTPLPPRFALRPIWEKAEIAAQKPLPPKSSVAEVFTMPEAKPKSSKFVGYAVKIAAGIVVVMATWFGASSIKMDRSLQVRAGATRSSSAPSPGSTSSAASTTVASSKPASKGMIAGVRESIARRASVQITDNLREGMEAWGAAAKAYPAGWSHNAEGYVRPGALALFSPTKTFTDYRMEFFGQIDSKGIGWTVRSKDENNYHAMKFSVIEAGLRPVIAMVHYNVRDGKPGRRLQTPLNVMVHNNKPFQVAVNIKGNSFVTFVDGEQVDTYSDDAPSSGGIGFFSDAGEKARLYWVKVSKNDDWLGHFCAFLSGVDAAPAGAELWAPELPGSPAPFRPDNSHASLAGAWIAVPFARLSRKTRPAKSRRNQEWNS
jgi:hypothetical protein